MPWSYLVAFKDYTSRAGWHRTAPELQIELQQRLHKTKSGLPVLRYFDAATMVTFQIPSKAQELTYCRSEDEHWECDEFVGIHPVNEHPEYIHLLASEYLTVGKSGAERGLFAAKDIPKHASLSQDESGKAFHIPPLTWTVISTFNNWAEKNGSTKQAISDVYSFAEDYGHGALLMGKEHMAIDSGIMLFMKHGCNGTTNYGYIDDDGYEVFTEMNTEHHNLTEVTERLINKALAFSPVYERNLRHALNSGDYALRDISKGKEVLTNYLEFARDPETLIEYVETLRKICGER